MTIDSEIKSGDLVRFAPSVINILSDREREFLKGLESVGLVIDIIVETYGTSLSENQMEVIFADVLWPAGHRTKDFTVHLRRVDDETPACKSDLSSLGFFIDDRSPTP